jgi:nicotinate-nucleotide pyrophosphorylase (carboxylating)
VIPPRPVSASNNPVLPLLPSDLCQLVDAALREDQAASDATTLALVPPERRARASMVLREPGVLAGLDLALAAFPALHPGASATRHHPDGADLPANTVVLTTEGPAGALLIRRTRRRSTSSSASPASPPSLGSLRIRALEGPSHPDLLDTRKTTPGWRRLEKYAVANAGAAVNHRAGPCGTSFSSRTITSPHSTTATSRPHHRRRSDAPDPALPRPATSKSKPIPSDQVRIAARRRRRH